MAKASGTLHHTEKGNTQPSLIDYLYGKKFCERWYDIEQALLEYVSRKPDGSFVNNLEEDKKDYELVCQALIEYFAGILKAPVFIEKMRERPAGQVLRALNSSRNIAYSFNYTPIEKVFETVYNDTVKVHGEIEIETIAKGEINKSHIILGIETNDINTIAPDYSFLIKSNNSAYKSSNLALDMLNSKNVIIFGHSMNQMDFGYFEGYFKMLCSNVDKERALTIITKDEASRVTIQDNLRKMGVSVMNIYAHTNVDYILTDKLDDKKSEDYKKFEKLLTKISEI